MHFLQRINSYAKTHIFAATYITITYVRYSNNIATSRKTQICGLTPHNLTYVRAQTAWTSHPAGYDMSNHCLWFKLL